MTPILFDEPKSLAGHKGPTKGNPPGVRGAGEAVPSVCRPRSLVPLSINRFAHAAKQQPTGLAAAQICDIVIAMTCHLRDACV
jgi:hypothetical protein